MVMKDGQFVLGSIRRDENGSKGTSKNHKARGGLRSKAGEKRRGGPGSEYQNRRRARGSSKEVTGDTEDGKGLLETSGGSRASHSSTVT